MTESIIFKIAAIGLLGIAAQWMAWRFRLPAILLMMLAGIVAGPVLGVLDPAEDFGEYLRPIVLLAVAVILFEGGLRLDFKDLAGTQMAVRRLVLLGVPIGAVLGSLSAHYVAGLSWPVAVVFGSILVVTGPTVIIPMLRQAKLARGPAAVLKWEGIINDPIGALLAVLAFEVAVHRGRGDPPLEDFLWIALASAIAAGIGIACGLALAAAFRRGLAPEFLKAPIILSVVVACYVAADVVEREAGLVAVTVMGVTLANARLPSIDEMRRFKENITVVLVSGVFVILTATLDREVLARFDWRIAAFVVVILFAVRPLTVWLSTIGTELTWRGRLLVGWIAPRGIVAVAVSGYFGGELVAAGFADGAKLTALAFAVVFATVIAHGFSIGWLARRLDLSASLMPGILIVGASPWSIGLARALKELEVPVTIADRNWHALRPARLEGIPVFYGEVLAEASEHRLDHNRFAYILAATDNDYYNALICSDFAPEFGRTNVFQLGPHEPDPEDLHALSFTLRGRNLLRSGADYHILAQRYREGWIFQRTRLTEEFDLDAYRKSRPEGAETLLIKRATGNIAVGASNGEIRAGPDDVVLAFSPPPDRKGRASARTNRRKEAAK